MSQPITAEQRLAEWAEAVGLVGTEFVEWDLVAADEVDASTIRKFCEPLGLDCALHYDDAVARSYGYRGIVAPVSAVTQVLVDPGIWAPGDADIWDSAEPDAQPPQVGIGKWIRDHLPGPRVRYLVMTDIEVEPFLDVCVGDRLSMRGQKLLACSPKQTKVGVGAFMTVESSCFNQRGEAVAVIRRSLFAYNSHAELEEDAR